ncbi:MAG: YHS domain-containing protein [Candidatus Bathyarchaeota archaeon]|nr:YHS domain-containing protein [Candidatus Bathyarchaeota archaeon]
MVKDPVCGMEVDEAKADLKYDHEGKTYYFCNTNCQENFKKNPKQYIE